MRKLNFEISNAINLPQICHRKSLLSTFLPIRPSLHEAIMTFGFSFIGLSIYYQPYACICVLLEFKNIHFAHRYETLIEKM